MVEESDIRDSLKDVEDPEMKISVIELGLIYGITTLYSVECNLRLPNIQISSDVFRTRL